MDELVPVVLPKAGMNMVEATVVAWRKEVGDPVAAGEGICDVQTDKVDMEIESPVAGTLAEILVAVDEDVEVGEPLARIRPAGDAGPR
jgi:pyruvate/2-oxoglutarate dehydrogenase complex dihydrolipoamide acyltransferase (E2) component